MVLKETFSTYGNTGSDKNMLRVKQNHDNTWSIHREGIRLPRRYPSKEIAINKAIIIAHREGHKEIRIGD